MGLSESQISAGMVRAKNTLSNGEPLVLGTVEDWASVLIEFRKIGFDNVEIHDGWLPFSTFSAQKIQMLLTALRSCELKAPSLAIARRSIIDPVQGEENLRYTIQALSRVRDLGSRMLCLGLHPTLSEAQLGAEYFWQAPGSEDSQEPDVYMRAVDGFIQIADRAAELGIELSLEIYEDTLLGSADQSLKLLSDIGRSNVGLNPDIGNLLRLDREVESWESMLEKLLPHTNYWHVKNYLRSATQSGFQTEPSTMEEGHVDYFRAFEMAEALDYSGIIVCEHYSHVPMPVLEKNREFIQRTISALAAAPIARMEAR